MDKIEVFRQRPLSWSCINQFSYDKEEWFSKYILGIKPESNPAMEFGKTIGERLAKDKKFLPNVPRYKVFEKKLEVRLAPSGLKLLGFLDSYDPKTKNFLEYKTSSNASRWTAESAQEHGQVLMYKGLLYLKYGVLPEEIDAKLVSIPCRPTGCFGVELVPDGKIQIFDTNHTSDDLFKFFKGIEKTYNKMIDYALDQIHAIE